MMQKGDTSFSDPFSITPSFLCTFYFFSQRLESTLSLNVSVYDFEGEDFSGKVMSHLEASEQATWQTSFAATLSLLGVWVSVDKPDYSIDCLLQGAD